LDWFTYTIALRFGQSEYYHFSKLNTYNGLSHNQVNTILKDPEGFLLGNSLGKEENITGFKYLPDQGLWNPGIIVSYQFYVSHDNKEWKLVSEGEFPNIKNNPLWQTKKFAIEKSPLYQAKGIEECGGQR